MNFNDFYNNLKWVKQDLNKNNYITPTPSDKKFQYYIDIYCIEFDKYILLINIYFLCNLIFYQKTKKKQKNKKLKKNNFFNTYF